MAEGEGSVEGGRPEWLVLSHDEYERASPIGSAMSARALHERFCRSVAAILVETPRAEALSSKPLRLRFKATSGRHTPLDVNVYMFTATQHPSERQRETFRIQLSHGQRPKPREARLRFFDRSQAPSILLVGYVPVLDVFILWDADLHDQEGFSYSRGVQCPPDVVYRAAAGAVSEESRTLKGGRVEHIVASPRRHLIQGIDRRFQRSFERMIGGRDAAS